MNWRADTHSLDYVRGLDAVLAQKIEDNMFTFEDLKELDARSLQLILRDIDRNVLVAAMKNASDILKTQIFANMSERAVEMLREEMTAQGPIRLSEVESAQPYCRSLRSSINPARSSSIVAAKTR